ncbi:MAG: diaminopimelate decarboxylase [Rubrobacteridae bacterium]|nr:diaminopimelate decarboxylase [Rubrobacteridae bacterium]
MVLPVTAKVNSDGHLEVGGCDTIELAQKYGTPLFIMDEETIRSQCRSFMNAFTGKGRDVEVIYASKAFSCIAMCQIAKQEGLGLDVMSGGEIFTAMKAGFPMEKAYMHGNNKTADELTLAIDNGLGRVVVDSFDEMELLNRLAGERGKKQAILLRITPGIKPKTHSFIQTGQMDSKFGFGLQDGLALNAVKKALEYENIDLKGIHAHIGSQIFELGSYAKAIEIIMSFVKQTKDETGFVVGELNAGGGLGIKYKAVDEPSTIEEYADVVVDGVAREAERIGIPIPKIMVEPGRAVVANSGITLYTVGTIKEIAGIRTYVSVDGGMSDNLRPMLYDAIYEALLANRANDKADTVVTVAGKHCESGDILIKDVELPHPVVGDILCTPTTGAYGYMMANNYNRQPRPAVVMVKDGLAKEIIRKETFEDLIRLDVGIE